MEYFSETGICGLSLKDIFSQTIDRVFLDELIVFQGCKLQVQTHILYILDRTVRQVFCTRSSAQVWLTVSVVCQTTQAYSSRQRINDI